MWIGAVASSLMLASCNNGGGNAVNGAVFDIAIPNVGATTNFSFDIGEVDPVAHRYYFTDRNNKSVDVIDTNSNSLIAQITGSGANAFAGVGADNAHSGPDGLNVITGTSLLYVGDVNSVKIVDVSSNQVVKTIVVSNSGLRADEGCYDPDDQVYMISSPEETPPFATFISTKTQTIIGKLTFDDSAGLEACVYDAATKSFYVNNDGTTANPDGEINVIPASTVVSGAPVVSKAYPLGNCDPAGIALGPGNEIAASCRPGTTGVASNFLIFDKTNGHSIATIPMGGGDQIVYVAGSNRYYSGASRWTASGLSPGACSAANPCTPVVGVIDAGTHTVVERLQSGNNAHSMAVDPTTNIAYVPHSSAAAPAGCATCSTFLGGGGGVAIVKTQ